MEFPVQLREKINELAQNADLKQLAAAADRLSENYRRENGFSASDKTEILAYAAVRMPATFAAVSRTLELSLESFGGEINSVLDAGAGTGAGAVSAALLTGCEKITCVEREGNMITLGREFLGCMGISAEWEQLDIAQIAENSADLVICSYCLNELPKNSRENAENALCKAAKKLLVIVEPGTPKAFRELLQTRERLSENGFKICAPCTFEGECGLPSDDWCHFTARAARTSLHKRLKHADVPYEDEKFCFLAAAREEFSRADMQRIIRRPVIASGRVTLRLCGGDGIKDLVVTRKDKRFKNARKSDTGDLFPNENKE